MVKFDRIEMSFLDWQSLFIFYYFDNWMNLQVMNIKDL